MFFFFNTHAAPRDLHSFPTRRSSDLATSSSRPPPTSTRSPRATRPRRPTATSGNGPRATRSPRRSATARRRPPATRKDRKSTRLNSSHSQISYAVFCLKKKKKYKKQTVLRDQARRDPRGMDPGFAPYRPGFLDQREHFILYAPAEIGRRHD